MKFWAPIMLAVAIVAGCQAQQKPVARTTNPAVLDVLTPASSYQPTTYTPPSATAVSIANTDPAPTATPAAASAPASNSKYVVKKGDTLFRIAKEQYGDGKQWRRIAGANPGVTPTSLRVGQTLVMP